MLASLGIREISCFQLFIGSSSVLTVVSSGFMMLLNGVILGMMLLNGVILGMMLLNGTMLGMMLLNGVILGMMLLNGVILGTPFIIRTHEPVSDKETPKIE